MDDRYELKFGRLGPYFLDKHATKTEGIPLEDVVRLLNQGERSLVALGAIQEDHDKPTGLVHRCAYNQVLKDYEMVASERDKLKKEVRECRDVIEVLRSQRDKDLRMIAEALGIPVTDPGHPFFGVTLTMINTIKRLRADTHTKERSRL